MANTSNITAGERTHLESLRKLAGMAYHGGKTPEHWVALVGVDPRNVKGIEISKGGLCYWTPKAERIYKAHINGVKHDMAMLQGRINA